MGAPLSMALASYAAGELLAATTLEKFINFGVGGLVNLYAMFQSIGLSLFFVGQKEVCQ